MSPPLTPQARALVAAGRAELEPTDGDLDRVRRRILIAAGAVGAGGAAAALASSVAPSAAHAAAASAATGAASTSAASVGATAASIAGTSSAAGAAAGSAAGAAVSAAGTAAGSAAGTAAAATAAGAGSAATVSGIYAGFKIGLVLLLTGAAAAGGGVLLSRARGHDSSSARTLPAPHPGASEQPAAPRVAAPPAPASQPRPEPHVEPQVEPEVEPEVEIDFAPDRVEPHRAATEPRRPPRAAPPPAPSQSAPSLGQELTLVSRARAALRLGMPDRALELLDQHAARFPAARLAQEAAVVRIEAVCATGDRARARALTEEFARTWPRSPLRARVWSMCGARP